VFFPATILTLGCSASSGPPPILVGHVAILSGPNNAAGEQAVRGIRLAVTEQNQTVAQNGSRPIHVRHTDTRGKLEAFEAEAVRLVTVSRVVALMGGTTSEEIARLDKAQVPIVTFGPRARGVSEQVFFTGLSPQFQGKALARFTADELHATKVIVLVDERREDLLLLAEAFQRELVKAGKDKAPQIWRFNKEMPAVDWADRMAEEKPQAVLLAGSSRDLLKIKKELHFTGPVLFAGEDISFQALLESTEARGVYLATAFTRDIDTDRAREFIASYRKTFSEEADNQAALAYEAARFLCEAIGRAQPNFETIPKELANLKDFPGLTGPLAFSPDRQLLRPAFIVHVEKGAVKTVKHFSPES
jgi:branched-chain amino acid transport system substrate-binding protein